MSKVIERPVSEKPQIPKHLEDEALVSKVRAQMKSEKPFGEPGVAQEYKPSGNAVTRFMKERIVNSLAQKEGSLGQIVSDEKSRMFERSQLAMKIADGATVASVVGGALVTLSASGSIGHGIGAIGSWLNSTFMVQPGVSVIGVPATAIATPPGINEIYQANQLLGVASAVIVAVPIVSQAAKYGYLRYQVWKSNFLDSEEFRNMRLSKPKE